MFDQTTHDFGNVARGSKAVYRFQVKNLYEETVHIAGIRSSCGCTTPAIDKHTLATFETAEITAAFNTTSFVGQKSATITVDIDQPFAARVQLQVRGNIRRDVTINPGVVRFGSVDQGSVAEKRITVSHAGRDSWSLLDVQSTNRHLEVELDETARGSGRVAYSMLVRLKPSMPAGYLSDELILVTNDPSAPQIPLPIEARLTPDLVVSPNSLYLGDLAPGQKVSKKLVVRSKTPFKIVDVRCPDEHFNFELSGDAQKLHVVNVTFVAAGSGKIEQQIQIQTDRPGGTAASLVAYANIAEGE